MGSSYFASTATHHLSPTSSKTDTRIYLDVELPAYTRTTTAWRDYPPASPHRLPTTGSGPTLPPQHLPKETKGVRMVSITGLSTDALSRAREYQPVVHRPRLRSRLTLGGQTWPRNPWSFGGRDSHSAFATHACILTPTPSTAPSQGRFTRRRTLPYPTTHSAETLGVIATASAVRLSPATLSAQDHLTSELLRTL
jgi:hypothetical protein